jgi:hypothetical protein
MISISLGYAFTIVCFLFSLLCVAMIFFIKANPQYQLGEVGGEDNRESIYQDNQPTAEYQPPQANNYENL